MGSGPPFPPGEVGWGPLPTPHSPLPAGNYLPRFGLFRVYPASHPSFVKPARTNPLLRDESMGVSLLNIERAVSERYSHGAVRREAKLCCPVDYDQQYLEVIPEEILVKDYGCGDPSRYLRDGETVLDLGSGTGKICFIASQIVGPKGKVIGVDMNTDMLALARRYQREVGAGSGGTT